MAYTAGVHAAVLCTVARAFALDLEADLACTWLVCFGFGAFEE